jgi:two-component system, OmpR family, alkaline phosphatase synthesis response regulator PhoP
MKQYRVLVADGDHDELATIAFQLKRDGFDVHAAADGGVALTLARKHRPDIVFIDVGIRYVNFARLITELRSDLELGHIKIVLMSNDPKLRGQPWMREVAVDCWFDKPRSATEFGKKTRELLEPNALSTGA